VGPVCLVGRVLSVHLTSALLPEFCTKGVVWRSGQGDQGAIEVWHWLLETPPGGLHEWGAIA